MAKKTAPSPEDKFMRFERARIVGARAIIFGITAALYGEITLKDGRDIRFDAKNGVLTLKGKVKTPQQRQQAQRVAANIPEVAQVVNEIEIKR